MNRLLEEEVWARANRACEYCAMPQAFYKTRFQIDHIISKQHGGATTSENLALSCYRCNTYKGPNIAGIDPLSGQVVALFHPRRQDWIEHFRWNGHELVGLTPTARATIVVLSINHPDYLAVRRSLMAEGRFPPVT